MVECILEEQAPFGAILLTPNLFVLFQGKGESVGFTGTHQLFLGHHAPLQYLRFWMTLLAS